MSEQAERYKSQGNAALQAKMFSDAVDLYTKACLIPPGRSLACVYRQISGPRR